MPELRKAFDLAVRNVARMGDTDVFPFPTENHIFHDARRKVVGLLMDIHKDLASALVQDEPDFEGALSLVTYEGLRWVTQIDPVWNAYLLGLVLSIAPEIESQRLAPEKRVVFSYRLAIDDERATLFADGGWSRFLERSGELAHEHEYVVACDIADFYSRVYHHRIKNALQLAAPKSDVPRRIEDLLGELSGGTSYGLPVGGPASRLLAELALARVDNLLEAEGIAFTRYADDYRLFAASRNDAFKALVFLSESLLRHEGLTLVKQKTRVVAASDFLRLPMFDAKDADDLSSAERSERRFLRLSLRYDPYSQNAAGDYERLKASLQDFDILEMLTREVNKSRVNPTVARRLAQAVRFLDEEVRVAAAVTLADNLEPLAPALPVTLRVLDDVLPSLPEIEQRRVTSVVRSSVQAQDYFLQVPVNLAYALRVLQHDRDDRNVALCTKLFAQAPAFIQRDIVYMMYNWNVDAFLSDKRRRWSSQHPWVRRAILVTSYALGDEGSHWRSKIKDRLSPFDLVARDWMSQRVAAGKTTIPL